MGQGVTCLLGYLVLLHVARLLLLHVVGLLGYLVNIHCRLLNVSRLLLLGYLVNIHCRLLHVSRLLLLGYLVNICCRLLHVSRLLLHVARLLGRFVHICCQRLHVTRLLLQHVVGLLWNRIIWLRWCCVQELLVQARFDRFRRSLHRVPLWRQGRAHSLDVAPKSSFRRLSARQ